MPLMETATAVVHTLGIMALSYALSPDGHLQAVVPRIEPERTKHQIRATADILKTGVESHVALLAFREKDRLGGNWKPQRHPAVRGYLYVELDGEHIDLIDGLPAGRTVQQSPQSISGLPRLKNCCPGAQLRAEFRPPFTGAAGVVNFPLGNSVTETCGATVAGTKTEETRKRIDTRIGVKNAGKLTIRAGSKEIILDGNAELYLANIPRWALTDPKGRHGAIAHYLVYFAMVENGTCGDYIDCVGEASLTCESVMRRGAPGGRTTLARAANDAPIDLWSWTNNAHIDYQCSNSQWP